MTDQLKNDRFEYYVSFCNMSEQSNPLWHSFLLISMLDRNDGPNARLKVNTAIGYYSSKFPIIGLNPMAQGTVRAEDPKFIADINGLFHETYKISLDELAELMTGVNQDKWINIEKKKPIVNPKDRDPEAFPSGEYRPSGPYYNLFKGDNCKRYALQKLEALNIDVDHLKGFLEIPRFTENLEPLKIKHSNEEGANFCYWDCPVIVSPRKKGETSEKIILGQQYLRLREGLEKIEGILLARQNILKEQGHQVEEISLAIDKIKGISAQANEYQQYPLRITKQQIGDWYNQLNNTIKDNTQSMAAKGVEHQLIHELIDALKETCFKVFHLFFGYQNKLESYQANTQDLWVMDLATDEVEELGNQFSRMKVN